MSSLAVNQASSKDTTADRPGWVPTALFPFRSRFVQLDEATLHYIDEGHGPPLLLTHGSPMWSFMYRRLIAELSGRYRCIAVDLPGLGRSRAPLVEGRAFSTNADWLAAFVERLDLRDAVLFVHATAGPSALRMALDARSRFRALALSNTFAWPLEGNRKLELIVRAIGSRPFAFANHHLNFLPRIAARKARRTGPFSADEREAILGPFHDVHARRHLQNILRSVGSERAFFAGLAERLDELKGLPTLLLYGAHDNGYRAGFLDRWRRVFPESEAVVLENAGHFPLEDEPGPFVDAAREWLDRVLR